MPEVPRACWPLGCRLPAQTGSWDEVMTEESLYPLAKLFLSVAIAVLLNLRII